MHINNMPTRCAVEKWCWWCRLSASPTNSASSIGLIGFQQLSPGQHSQPARWASCICISFVRGPKCTAGGFTMTPRLPRPRPPPLPRLPRADPTIRLALTHATVLSYVTLSGMRDEEGRPSRDVWVMQNGQGYILALFFNPSMELRNLRSPPINNWTLIWMPSITMPSFESLCS